MSKGYQLEGQAMKHPQHASFALSTNAHDCLQLFSKTKTVMHEVSDSSTLDAKSAKQQLRLDPLFSNGPDLVPATSLG